MRILVVVFSSVVCCIEWHLPPCRSGVGVETCVTLSLVDPTDLLFLYMFSVFPLFSLSTCTSWTCLLWMCAVVPFHLISPPGCGSYQFKTTANMRLLNGFPFFFLFFFSLYPLPLSLCFYYALTGVQEQCEKKPKVNEDGSGLVPYGGDSSDEEDERTHSSKTDYS